MPDFTVETFDTPTGPQSRLVIQDPDPCPVQFAPHPGRQEAEALIAKAAQSADRVERIALAHQALAVWPESVPAYQVLIELSVDNNEYRLGLRREAIEAGKRSLRLGQYDLGDQGIGIAPDGLLVLQLLGEQQSDARLHGHLQIAIDAGEEAMFLDASDPLGLRFRTVACALEQRSPDRLPDLIAALEDWVVCDDDHTAVWCYFLALARYQSGGDCRRSREDLLAALEADATLGVLIAFSLFIPEDHEAHASVREAVPQRAFYTAVTIPAWFQTPGALSWLEVALIDYVDEHPGAVSPAFRSLLGGSEPGREGTPLERADLLIELAQRTNDPDGRRGLVDMALALTDDCSRAYALAARLEATPARKLELYLRALGAAERQLGPDALSYDEVSEPTVDEEHLPRWLDFLTALNGVAYHHWVLGDRRQAIEEYWRLASLDRNEECGPYAALLTTCYLEERTPGGADAARTLCRDHRDPDADLDRSQTWILYGLVLAAIQLGSPMESDIAPALAAAVKNNPLVPLLLLGDWEMPKRLPVFNDESEYTDAVDYVSYAKSAWAMTPGALDLLAEVAVVIRALDMDQPELAPEGFEGETRSALAVFVNPL